MDEKTPNKNCTFLLCSSLSPFLVSTCLLLRKGPFVFGRISGKFHGVQGLFLCPGNKETRAMGATMKREATNVKICT